MKYFNSASLILTENCNLACEYCYTLKSRQNRSMTEEVARKSIDFLADGAKRNGDGRFHITYFGGEPLLNLTVLESSFDYALEVAKANNLQFDCQIVTNCTIFTQKYMKFLARWKQILGRINVQLSVDGPPEVQDRHRITVNGHQSSSVINMVLRDYIDFAAAHGIKLGDEIHVHSIVTPESLPQLYETYMYFRRLGFPGIWIMPLHEADWTEEDISTFERLLSNIADQILSDCKEHGTLEYYTAFSSSSRCPNEHPEKPCAAGYTYCSITPDGDIYPCHRFYFEEPREFHLGTLGDEWDKINENRRFFLDYTSSNMMGTNQCRACKNYSCYRCIAANRSKTKNYLLVNPSYCSMSLVGDKVRNELARKLQEAGLLENTPRPNQSSDLSEYVYELTQAMRQTFSSLESFLNSMSTRLDQIHTSISTIVEQQQKTMDLVAAAAGLLVGLAELQQKGPNG